MQVAVSPLTSVTVHMTEVVPTGNDAGALFVKEATPQLSLVVGVPRLTPVATQLPASVFTETLAGQVMVGAV